jgi:hypothetical protein
MQHHKSRLSTQERTAKEGSDVFMAAAPRRTIQVQRANRLKDRPTDVQCARPAVIRERSKMQGKTLIMVVSQKRGKKEKTRTEEAEKK